MARSRTPKGRKPKSRSGPRSKTPKGRKPKKGRKVAKKSEPRKLTPYNRFFAKMRKQGKTPEQIGKAWRGMGKGTKRAKKSRSWSEEDM